MYLSDIIADAYKGWQAGAEVRIEAPTGFGKSFFILYVLLPYALQMGLEILYVSNRVILDKQLIKDVSGITGVPFEYMRDLKFAEFPGITLTTYQTLQEKIGNNKLQKDIPFYHYMVFDEFAYIASDSLYNPKIGRFMKWFPIAPCAVKITISATMESTLSYIDFDSMVYLGGNDVLNIYTRARNFSDVLYHRNPVIYHYHIQNEAPKINVITYEKVSDIVKEINEDNTDKKWIVFHNNIEKAKDELRNKIKCDVEVLTSADKESDTMRSIVEENKFNAKVLLTTKVLDVGVSLHDKKIKNIVFHKITDKYDLIQMFGRRRIADGEDITLNVYIPQLSTGYFRTKRKREIEPSIEFCQMKPEEFAEAILASKQQWKRGQKFLDVIDGKYVLNPIALKELERMRAFSLKMEEGLENDPNYFVKECCRWLRVDSDSEILDLHEKTKKVVLKELSDFMRNIQGKILDKKEQKVFRKQIKPMLEVLSPKIKKNSNPGLNLINKILEEHEVGYCIRSISQKKKGGETKWEIRKKD